MAAWPVEVRPPVEHVVRTEHQLGDNGDGGGGDGGYLSDGVDENCYCDNGSG